MIARLIRPDGTVKREWQTPRPDLAMSADRNYPDGWRVDGGWNCTRDLSRLQTSEDLTLINRLHQILSVYHRAT